MSKLFKACWLLKCFFFLIFFQFSTNNIIAQSEAIWAKALVGKGHYDVVQSFHDQDQNLVIVGIYDPQYLRPNQYDTMDFDPGPGKFTNFDFPHHSAKGTFVLKLDSQGKFLWVKNFDVAQCLTAAQDKNDNIYLSFIASNKMDADPSSGTFLLENLYDFGALVRLDKNGNFIHAIKTHENHDGDLFVNSIAFDDNNNLVLGGEYDGSSGKLTILDSTISVNNYSYQMCLVGLSPGLKFQWFYAPNGDYNGSVTSVNTHKNKIYFSGTFFDNIEWVYKDSVQKIPRVKGQPDLFYGAYSPSLGLQWIKNIDNEERYGGISCQDLFVNSEEKLILNIHSPNKLDLSYNTGTYDQPTGDSALNTVLLKAELDGEIIWAKYVQGGGLSYTDKHIYLTGWHHSYLDVDPDFGISFLPVFNPRGDIMMLKFDYDGNFLWGRSFGAKSNLQYQIPYSTSVDGDENISVLSRFAPFHGDLGLKELSDTLIPPMQSYYSGISVVKFKQNDCANNALSIKKIQDFTCSQSAIIQGKIIGDASSWKWNIKADSMINDSTVVYSKKGYFQFNINNKNCSINRSFYIDGPEIDTVPIIRSSTLGSGVIRPGQIIRINQHISNPTCIPIDGSVVLHLKKHGAYVDAKPRPLKITKDSVVYQLKDFAYKSGNFKIELDISIDTTSNIGDTIIINSDITIWDENKDSIQKLDSILWPIINSYDPNYLAVTPQKHCDPKYILKDDSVKFHIEFQNEGNADALKVQLINFIDPNIDASSFKVLQNSHKISSIYAGPNNQLFVVFDNINLAPKSQSEAESIGFIDLLFTQINKPLNQHEFGNKTNIYFDYNQPITTNIRTTQIVDQYPQNTVSISNNDGTLFPSIQGESYNWYECKPAFKIIENADSSSYSPKREGYYAVIVKNGDCTDTSDCFYFDNSGIDRFKDHSIIVYPNPSNGLVHLKSLKGPIQELNIVDFTGKTIIKKQINSSLENVQLEQAGMYYFEIKVNNRWTVQKVIMHK